MRYAQRTGGSRVDAKQIKADGGPGPQWTYTCDNGACGVAVTGVGLKPIDGGHPHFAIPPRQVHALGCVPAGQTRTQAPRPGPAAPAVTVRPPAAAPTRLVLSPGVRHTRTDGSRPPARPSRGGPGGAGRRTHPAGRVADSVEELCRALLAGQATRRDRLAVEGVDGATYGEVFARLSGRLEDLGRTRVYAAPLLFAAQYAPTVDADRIVIRVGAPGAERAVVADWRTWTPAAQRDFAAAVSRARRARQAVYRTPEDREAWVCALGAPGPEPTVLTVDHPGAVCCVFV